MFYITGKSSEVMNQSVNEETVHIRLVNTDVTDVYQRLSAKITQSKFD